MIPRPTHKGEDFEKGSMTETAGYIPAHKKIQSLLDAGTRLSLVRKEMYDAGPDATDIPIDPTRRPGIDMAEVAILARETNQRIARQIQERKEKARQEAIKPADTPPAEGPKG